MRWFVAIWFVLAAPSLAAPYVLKSGDLLRIEVIEDSSLNRNALVLPDGTIAFPMIGQVKAAGQTLEQVRNALASGLAPNFRERPSLHVAVAAIAKTKGNARQAPTTPALSKTITVFGMGELAKPGKMQIEPGTSLMQFLAQAGGTTAYAAIKRIQIRRATSVGGAIKTYRVNVKKLMGGSDKSFELFSGDVVIVPERKLFE